MALRTVIRLTFELSEAFWFPAFPVSYDTALNQGLCIRRMSKASFILS